MGAGGRAGAIPATGRGRPRPAQCRRTAARANGFRKTLADRTFEIVRHNPWSSRDRVTKSPLSAGT